MNAEEKWADWWASLSPQDKEAVTELEAEVGCELTWNQRYLLVRERQLR